MRGILAYNCYSFARHTSLETCSARYLVTLAKLRAQGLIIHHNRLVDHAHGCCGGGGCYKLASISVVDGSKQNCARYICFGEGILFAKSGAVSLRH